MGCLTQILLLLDAISSSSSEADEADAEAAQTLTTQLIYAGAPLDLALDCLKVCTAATATGRGPEFLDAAVHFAYAVVRMLERGSSGGEAVYVRRAKKRAKKGGDDADDAAEDERKRQEARETTFSLEAFEMARSKSLIRFGYIANIQPEIRDRRNYARATAAASPLQGARDRSRCRAPRREPSPPRRCTRQGGGLVLQCTFHSRFLILTAF